MVYTIYYIENVTSISALTVLLPELFDTFVYQTVTEPGGFPLILLPKVVRSDYLFPFIQTSNT